jgi:hypothetical protein
VATRASLLALLVPMPGSCHPPFPLVAENIAECTADCLAECSAERVAATAATGELASKFAN